MSKCGSLERVFTIQVIYRCEMSKSEQESCGEGLELQGSV